MRKNKQRSYVGIVVILIVIAAAAGLITTLAGRRLPSKERADLGDCFFVEKETDVGLVVDGHISAEPLTLSGNEIYAPYHLIKSLINDRFYLDEEAGLLTVTTPTEIRNFPVAELEETGEAVIGGDGAGSMAESVSLALSFVETWTDCELTPVGLDGAGGEAADAGQAEAGEEAVPRLVMRKTFPYKEASVTEETQMRTRPTIKAPILMDAAAGDVLTVVDTDDTAEGWTPVMAADGRSGYVRSEALGETSEAGAGHASRLGEYTSKSLGQKVNMAFYPTNNETVNSWLMDRLAGTTGLNVVSPTWFFLEGPGEVTSYCDPSIVEAVHGSGLQVWALINDIDGHVTDSDGVAAVLSGTESRQAIERTVIDTALAAGVDGINIDIEHVREDTADAYLTFVREMSALCRVSDLYLSVDTTVPMAYSAFLNRAEQGILADYVIIMCYDEHFAGSPEAGSVASQGFLEDGISNTLKEVPADKVVAGIPFYTRLWEIRDNGAPSSSVMSMSDALAYADSEGMDVYWDEDVCQYVAEKTEDGVFYQIWLEDSRSIEAKTAFIRSSGIAGVAGWCLGNETPDVWPVIAAALGDA